MRPFSSRICLLSLIGIIVVTLAEKQIHRPMSYFANWRAFPYVPNPPDFNPRDYTFENVPFKLAAGTYNELCYFTDFEHGSAPSAIPAAPHGFQVYRKVAWSESSCPMPDGWRTTKETTDAESAHDEGATVYMTETHDDDEISSENYEATTVEAQFDLETERPSTETIGGKTTINGQLPAQFTFVILCPHDGQLNIELASKSPCADPVPMDVCVAVDPGTCQLTDYFVNAGKNYLTERKSANKFYIASEEGQCGATLQLFQTNIDGEKPRGNYTSANIDGYEQTGFWVWETAYCEF